MARPSIYSDEIVLRICHELEQGNSIADACALAGIHEDTYHDWTKRGDAGEQPFSEFSELTRESRARGRKKCVQAIRKATRKNWRAAAFFLERSDPANWGRKDKLSADVTSGGKPIEPIQQVIFYVPENGRDTPRDPTAAGPADDVPG